MPVCGDLSTMSLIELLRWAAAGQRTGVLEVEQNRICRKIEFRKGWIGACATDDPPAQLGQILLSRGRIDRERLRQALERQEQTGQSLGVILVQMGLLAPREVLRYISEKAEETIQGLFDWDDAVFRYHEGATLEPDQIEVNLSVDEMIERGLRHQAELARIRQHFASSGVVLAPAEAPAPARLFEHEVARRIYESVDGQRTIAEILLHAHASAFLVLKLLSRLYERGVVRICGERSVDPGLPTLLDLPRSMRRKESWSWTQEDLGRLVEGDLPEGEHVAPAPDEMFPEELERRQDELDVEVDVAARLMHRREYAAALELLNASYRANPGDGYLRRLIARAEQAYTERLRRRDFSYDRTPVALPDALADPRLDVRSEESFLLSLIDGDTDIKSILWLSPLREVDVLRALERMLDRGMIRIDPPRERAATTANTESEAAD